MKTRSLFGVLLSLLLVLAVAGGVAGQSALAAQSPDYITVVVKEGESLATYARIYGVSGLALLAANPTLKDPNLIRPGQTLVIPVVKSFTPSLTTPFYYTVKAGDTIYLIARRFHMDATSIAYANGITNNIVILGKTILIPAGPHYHIVAKGETLYSIAAYYGTPVQSLQTGNDFPSPDEPLFAGQYLFIPTIFDAQPLLLIEPTAMPSNTPTATLKPGTAQPTATATTKPGTTVPPATPTKTTTPQPSATPTKTATSTPTSTTDARLVEGQYIKVTVRTGESLVTYTYRYGVTGGLLLAANPQLKDPNRIYGGDVLTIPVIASFMPSRTTPFFYVMQAGDTLSSLAAKFEMVADTLILANPGGSFLPGSTILVPAGPHWYTVKVGDELRYIAAKYGTTPEALQQSNEIPNPDKIYSGQPIFIPIRYNAQPIPYN